MGKIIKKAGNRIGSIIEQIFILIYARVSSKEQEAEGYSVPSQIKLCQDYAKKVNIPVAKIFAEASTAKTAGRKQFDEMVTFIRNREPNTKFIIVVEKTDRLSRNFKDIITLDDLKVEIHFVKEGLILCDKTPSSDRLIHDVRVVLAKNYIQNLAEETAKGMREKAEQGVWPSVAPLGYLNSGENKRRIITPDPVLGKIVAKMFDWYATGIYSLKDVSKMAFDEGLRYRKTNARVNKSVIHKILTNPIYSGEFNWAGVSYKGVYEPLITRELFDKVQEIMSGRNAGTAKPRGKFFTYQGMVICGKCGCAMVGEMKKGKYIYYHCTQNRGPCTGKCTREEVLTQQFTEALKRLQIDPDVVEWMLAIMKSKHANDTKYHQDIVTGLEKQKNQIQVRLDKVYEDKLDGVITEEEYSRYSAKYRKEASEIELMIGRHTTPNENYLEDATQLLELSQKAASLYFAQPMEEKRKLLEIVHSNSIWEDGNLTCNFKKPFDLMVVTNMSYHEKRAGSHRGNDPFAIWLPNPDSNQGQGG